MFTSLGEIDQGRDRKSQRSLKLLSDSSDLELFRSNQATFDLNG